MDSLQNMIYTHGHTGAEVNGQQVHDEIDVYINTMPQDKDMPYRDHEMSKDDIRVALKQDLDGCNDIYFCYTIDHGVVKLDVVIDYKFSRLESR
ncbi:hypothetical protein H4219_004488 [Mycoemilia scoparia]|uniref:Uncharacterized protein n=1 Tax=Mycoemilia scoparia TaxID=417184 RepID=A0A9W7ZX84_9FUNG|nr:hypothetical protein H4219_004488 [Mycoemilia scoparia]